MNTIEKFLETWASKEGKVHSTQEILEWIAERNNSIKVDIKKITPEEDNIWKYCEEDGILANPQRSFFTIGGIMKGAIQQPIIIQDEIGYLGILCKEIQGVLHFLMQAKIEPGNVNKIQISPTIQATKSNFTQKHGGTKPSYLDYFINAEKYEIVVDQVQSEQAARFIGKRNRNIIVVVGNEDVKVLPSHRWMTLGQIKDLMKYDNLVNMDTRTVISCIPFYQADPLIAEKYFTNKSLFKSVVIGDGVNYIPKIFRYINDIRMFDKNKPQLVSLTSMNSWHWDNGEFVNKEGYHFKVIFCDIAIEGREVKRWTQPLFEAVGLATFGLMCCEEQGITKFLVRVKNEIGSFDGAELSPTLQLEADEEPSNYIERLFMEKYSANEGILHNVILSEEGGRFYHEQNRNIILMVDRIIEDELPEGYIWVDYRTLNMLVQVNNCLNIQLRNVLSLLEV